MLIYFARHGQTDHNLKGIIQGQMDTHLNDTGRNEARVLRHHLRDIPFTVAWSSSLSRAKETADIVAGPHELTVSTHPGLMERDFGSLNGKRRQRGVPLPTDIESSQDFRARVSRWVDDFLAHHATLPADAPVLIISHGAYLSALLGIFLSPPYSFSAAGVDIHRPCLNTCIMRVSASYRPERGGWSGRILGWAEVDHLGAQARDLRVADDVRESVREVMIDAAPAVAVANGAQ